MPTNYNEQYRIESQARELEDTPIGAKGDYKITTINGTKVSTEQVSGYIYYPFAVRKDGKEWALDHVPTGLFIMSFALKGDVAKYLRTVDLQRYDSADMGNKEVALAWGKLREDLSKIKFFITV